MIGFNQCDDVDCTCNKPRAYWIEVDPVTGNPLSSEHICYAYYPDDKPIEGSWILVRESKDQ